VASERYVSWRISPSWDGDRKGKPIKTVMALAAVARNK